MQVLDSLGRGGDSVVEGVGVGSKCCFLCSVDGGVSDDSGNTKVGKGGCFM